MATRAFGMGIDKPHIIRSGVPESMLSWKNRISHANPWVMHSIANQASGLYIDKNSLPLILRLSMPVVCATSLCHPPYPKANLSVTYPRCTDLSKARLCHALHILLGSTRCTAEASQDM